MKRIIETPNAPAPIGPYSQAVLYDDTLYTSGQIAIDPATWKSCSWRYQSGNRSGHEKYCCRVAGGWYGF